MNGEFINEATKIVRNANNEKLKQGENFNIFSILNIENKEESTHCRFLYELLSPYGSHYQNDLFLKMFFKLVLEKEYPAHNNPPIVRREFNITDKSRVDLMIDNSDFCYIIEVKINAGEQSNQILRYSEWAENEYENYHIFFLTKTGYLPETAGNYLEKQKVTPIAFNGRILNWLDECYGECQKRQLSAICDAISQYQNLLKKITSEEYNAMEKLVDHISSSAENFECALEIERQLPNVQGKKMAEVFNAIRQYIENNYPYSFLVENYSESSIDYYIRGKSCSYPSVNFILKENEESYYVLSIEVEWKLFIGISKFGKDKKKCMFESEELKTISAKIGGNSKSEQWAYWEYLPSNKNQIDFHEKNAEYKKLYNPQEFAVILESVQTGIKSFIENYASKI